MGGLIKTRIIKIGNSHGIRIPRLVLDQIGLANEVEIEVQADQLVIRPSHSPRHDWDAQFQAMAQRGEDRLLDTEPPPTKWETEEWEW